MASSSIHSPGAHSAPGAAAGLTAAAFAIEQTRALTGHKPGRSESRAGQAHSRHSQAATLATVGFNATRSDRSKPDHDPAAARAAQTSSPEEAPATTAITRSTSLVAANETVVQDGSSRAVLASGLATPTAIASSAALPGSGANLTALQAGVFTNASLLQSLAARPVLLAQQPWPAPGVQLAVDTAAHLLLVAAQRWAIELMAGPAVTYRTLGQPAPADQPIATASLNGRTLTEPVKNLERPALGYGAQLQLRRVLNGRWAFSTGLGYHEYATSLSLRIVPPTRTPSFGTAAQVDDSTITTINTRDTYRFLTMPVRLSYQLGPGGRRFRYGVQAGADVALYLGGSSSEGSACGCEPRTMTLADNPYRRLSLALSAGLDLRYRVAPRWEILAQPTATYFMNSLARPALGYAPRRLFGAGLQLGTSFDLR
jgi:hypothetical protein